MKQIVLAIAFFTMYQNTIIEANTLNIIARESLKTIRSTDHPAIPLSIKKGLDRTLGASLLTTLGLTAISLPFCDVSCTFYLAGLVTGLPGQMGMVYPKVRSGRLDMISNFYSKCSDKAMNAAFACLWGVGAVATACTTVFNSKNAALSMLTTKEDTTYAISDIGLQQNITNIYE